MNRISAWIAFSVFLFLFVHGCARKDDFQMQDTTSNLESDTFPATAWANAEGRAALRGDQYEKINENASVQTADQPLSTFSIDVDTASYANVRRYLRDGQMPPRDAVRIEELVNYFDYNYEQPAGETPIHAHIEVAECPWQAKKLLVRIGVQGKRIAPEKRPASNLVFLLDVSGSMHGPDRLPLLKHGLLQMLEGLTEEDRVAIVVYAGASGLVLPSTPATDTHHIREAIARIRAGGSTNGGDGIRLAYDVAMQNFVEGGVNRVILATDGDFNVGTTSSAELVNLVEEQASSGVFLTVLGFGRGNLNDAMMEQISNRGNGNYAYIDSAREAHRVLVDQLDGTLVTIAKDVKIQVEFDSAKVASYRLVGYENRLLAAHEFEDDRKDAGEMGAGHQVTALYEIEPVDTGVGGDRNGLSDGELLRVKIRYKEPDGDISQLLSFGCPSHSVRFQNATSELQFAAAVAEFGMLLRGSQYGDAINYRQVMEHAQAARGRDRSGHRAEFMELVRAAQSCSNQFARY